MYSTKSHRFTVVGSSTVNNLISLYIGTDKGYVIRVPHSFAYTYITINIASWSVKISSTPFEYPHFLNLLTFCYMQDGLWRWLIPSNCGSVKIHLYILHYRSDWKILTRRLAQVVFTIYPSGLEISKMSFIYLKLLYDTEKNKTSVLAEFNLDSSEIKAIKSVNGKTYIMSQNKVLVFVYLCFNKLVEV